MMEDQFFMGAPPVVSNRNHFRSLDLIVEEWLFRFDTRDWPLERLDAFSDAMKGLAGYVVQNAAWAFRAAAERGIDQVENILRDPEFYRSTKKRRDAGRKAYLEGRRKDREERDRAQFEPSTPAQINAKIRHLESMAAYHKSQAEKYEKEVREFKENPAKHLKLQSVDAKVIA